MQEYQREFIQFAIENKVLCFGDFTLKSGRKSPYFFNSGLFNNGITLGQLGHYYASAIQASNIEFDMLFGPAYKGIPLATAVAVEMARSFSRNLPFCFNRKEIKGHGEGGGTFGADLQGRVLIIDDVISAGTSINLSIDIITAAGAEPVAVAVAMDRQERGQQSLSAVQEIEQRHGVRVINIITLDDMIEFLTSVPGMADKLEQIRDYRQAYGADI